MMLFAIASCVLLKSAYADGMMQFNSMNGSDTGTPTYSMMDSLMNEAVSAVRNILPYPFSRVSNQGLMDFGKLLMNGMEKPIDEIGDELDTWAEQNGLKDVFDRFFNSTRQVLLGKRQEMNNMISQLYVNYKQFADILEDTTITPVQMMQKMSALMQNMDMAQKQLLMDLIAAGYATPSYYRRKRSAEGPFDLVVALLQKPAAK